MEKFLKERFIPMQDSMHPNPEVIYSRSPPTPRGQVGYGQRSLGRSRFLGGLGGVKVFLRLLRSAGHGPWRGRVWGVPYPNNHLVMFVSRLQGLCLTGWQRLGTGTVKRISLSYYLSLFYKIQDGRSRRFLLGPQETLSDGSTGRTWNIDVYRRDLFR